MVRHRTNLRVVLTSVCAAGILAAAGLSMGMGERQPEEPAPERRLRDAVQRFDDPVALRARLERTIERGESMLERHREAITRLDAGESPAEVMRSLRWRESPQAEDAPEAPVGLGTPEGRPEGPQGRRGDRPEGGRLANLDPAARQRLRVFLRDRLPSVDAQLSLVEGTDPEMAGKLFERLLPQLREISDEMQRDPVFGELRLEEMRTGLGVVDASQRLRMLGPSPTAADRAAAEADLRAAIAARFDVRIRLRQHELERLATRIGELHTQIQDEQAGREAEIERVFQAVINHRGPMKPPGRSEDSGQAEPRP